MKKILLITALASLSACGGSGSGGSDGNSQTLGSSPISLQNKQFNVSQSDFVTDCPRPARSLFTSPDPAQLEQTGLFRLEVQDANGTHFACLKGFNNHIEQSLLSFSKEGYEISATHLSYSNSTFHSQQASAVISKAQFDAALKNGKILDHEQEFNPSFQLLRQAFIVEEAANKLTNYEHVPPNSYSARSGSATKSEDNAPLTLENGVLIGQDEDGEIIRLYKLQ